ncbi:aminodeoxychorismate synthase component I [Gordonia sp. NPDC003425]
MIESRSATAGVTDATAVALRTLRRLESAARRRGVPGPAALVGDWCDADAVIAPSIEIRRDIAPPDLPTRFWLGYLGFGGRRGRESALPVTAGGLTDRILLLRNGSWEHVALDGSAMPDWVRHAVDDTTPPEAHTGWTANWTAPPHEPHLDAIEKCLDAIRAGEIYQACVCTRFTGTLDGSALDYYADLTRGTAPAKSAFLQGEWGAVASFSPETFLRRSGSTVWSAPIKGTVAADADPVLLSTSTKDVAENVMIVDLVRNDLGRVAEVGTVRVADLLRVVPAPGVWHLVSRVQAQLNPAVGNDRLLDATWPPASVTGTPKLRALDLLDEWEPDSRGVYCGAVGLAGPDHMLDLNVAIRTVEIDPGGRTSLGVGGGITIDSVPHREWQECLDKAHTIITARQAPVG